MTKTKKQPSEIETKVSAEYPYVEYELICREILEIEHEIEYAKTPQGTARRNEQLGSVPAQEWLNNQVKRLAGRKSFRNFLKSKLDGFTGTKFELSSGAKKRIEELK